MAKTKFDFIADLLKNEKFDPNQKDKFLGLTLSEINKTSELDDDLKKDVEKIKAKLNIGEGGNNESLKSNSSEERKPIHNPKKLVEILKIFTEGNGHIKYSTHIWDESKFLNYKDFTEGLKREYKEKKLYQLIDLNSNLFWKVKNFLVTDELSEKQKKADYHFNWGRHNIKIGWQFPDTLKEWCKEHFDNKGVDSASPFSMEIPSKLLPKGRINGKTIKYFEDIVNIFKEEIEFRDNKLLNVVQLEIKNKLINFNVDKTQLETLKGKSFYTDTESITKVIAIIFNMIIIRTESREIDINCRLDENQNKYILEILHLNSFSNKELKHSKILLNENSGDLSNIRNKLISLCDFSIESRFTDSNNKVVSAKIDYLFNGIDESFTPRTTILPEQSTGFKFILAFPAT